MSVSVCLCVCVRVYMGVRVCVCVSHLEVTINTVSKVDHLVFYGRFTQYKTK